MDFTLQRKAQIELTSLSAEEQPSVLDAMRRIAISPFLEGSFNTEYSSEKVIRGYREGGVMFLYLVTDDGVEFLEIFQGARLDELFGDKQTPGG